MLRVLGKTAAATIALAAVAAAVPLVMAFGPTLFGAEALIVTSGSMGDAAPIGSVAVTRRVDARAIAVGDVISFRRATSRATITHRVVEISMEDGRSVFHTKGDANAAPDVESVVVSGSVHRVERVVPYAGYIAGFARTPIGMVVLFMVPIAGLAVDHRRRAVRTAIPPKETVVTPPPPTGSGPSREALVLGAVAGVVVAGAIASLGRRPAR